MKVHEWLVEKGRRRRRWLLGAGTLTAAALVGWSQLRRPIASAATAEEKGGGNDAPVLDGKLIRFSDAFARRAGIAGTPATVQGIAPVVTVGGTMAFDARRFATVGARIAGRVRRVLKVDGDAVAEGDVLAEVESAELGRAEAQVLAARAREKAAEADMKRERQLADVRVVAEREAELARASYEAARADRIAAERTVEALGGDLKGEVGVLPLRSPMAGQVVEVKTVRGQTVDPTQTLFQVADLHSLWVELRVFERDLGTVVVGDEVEISSSGSREALHGKVDHVGDVIDVDSRTAPVRVVVGNESATLRPGQSVIARIHAATPAKKSLTLPRRAVTRIDGQSTIFVMHDRNTVEPRPVITGAEDAERVAVLDGLRAGERVVVEGTFALKSELFR